MLPITSIIRQATRHADEKYNILVGFTHERYESCLARTGHNFYAFPHEYFKPYWQTKFAEIPPNYHILPSQRLPESIKFDLVLSQNKFGQYQVLGDIAKQLHLPLMSLEHTLPFTEWDEKKLQELRSMRGNLDVFISEYSLEKWGFQMDNNTHVVHHGLDTEQFKPDDRQRKNHVLSVVNDWKNRDWCCGYYIWTRIIKGLPYHVVGDNPGMSRPSNGTDDLINSYRDAAVFLNTSTISPVPMSLMEAMACGCAVVSTATCMIPEIITNGYDGFISNDEAELRKYTEMLLGDAGLRDRMGKAARLTIAEKFGLDKFVRNWNNLFDIAAHKVYVG